MTHEQTLQRERNEQRKHEYDWPSPLPPPSRWEWECVDCGGQLVEQGNRRHCPACLLEYSRQLALIEYSRYAHRMADAYASDDERRGRVLLTRWEQQRIANRLILGCEPVFIE